MRTKKKSKSGDDARFRVYVEELNSSRNMRCDVRGPLRFAVTFVVADAPDEDEEVQSPVATADRESEAAATGGSDVGMADKVEDTREDNIKGDVDEEDEEGVEDAEETDDGRRPTLFGSIKRRFRV
jgi:hypothetical protein